MILSPSTLATRLPRRSRLKSERAAPYARRWEGPAPEAPSGPEEPEGRRICDAGWSCSRGGPAVVPGSGATEWTHARTWEAPSNTADGARSRLSERGALAGRQVQPEPVVQGA